MSIINYPLFKTLSIVHCQLSIVQDVIHYPLSIIHYSRRYPLSIVNYPLFKTLSIVHYQLSIVHCQLSIVQDVIHCPLSIIHYSRRYPLSIVNYPLFKMLLELFLAELRRSWIQFIRYPFEAIGGIFITTTIFYGLFLGAKYVAGPAFQIGDRFDAIVVGYVLWTLVLFIAADLSSVLQLEAQTGTLEQLFLSPFPAVLVLFLRAIADLAIQLLLIGVILFILIALTGSKIAFPPLLILPLLSIIFGAYGLSFLMASLALLLKRVQQVLSIFQFGLLFVLASPSEEWLGWGKLARWLIPMTGGAGLLRDLMARGKALNWLELGLAFANGLTCLAIGLIAFRFCENQVKRKGKLGGY